MTEADMQIEQLLRSKNINGGSRLRTELKDLLRAQSAAAAQKLAAGAPADDELHRIDQIQTLLKFLPESNRGRLFGAGAIAAACLVVASLPWTIRPSAHVQMTVTTDKVIVGLDKSFNWSGTWNLNAGKLRMEYLSRVELPPELTATNLLTGLAWLESSNGNFALKSLELQANAEISFDKLDQGDTTWRIAFRNAPMLGQLEVSGAPAISAGRSPGQPVPLSQATFGIPRIVPFNHDGGQTAAVLSVTPRNALELVDLPIKQISFAREEEEEEGSDTLFRSAIVKGKLTILSTKEEVPLDAGSRLRLSGVKGVISNMTIGDGGITLAFDGMVGGASIGPLGYERELRPSWLEILFHQQRFGFFWSAVTFIWGLLWGARALVSR